jgi:hypothetical protein
MPYGKTGLGFMSPGGVSVQSGVDMATISEAQRSVAVPVSFLRGNQKARRHEGIEDRITATITDQGCYVAFHDSVESPYTLYRLDRATGMVLWSTNVSAGGYTGGTGTGYKHAVGLLPRENTVWVFGVGIYAVYVEKFSAENGKSQFRFTTAY